MLLEGRKGIRCDLCGNIYKNIFDYYPAEICEMVAKTSQKYVYPPKLIKECDIGMNCINNYIETIKNNPDRQITKLLIPCDSCPTVMKGDFKYYLVNLAKVSVNTSEKNTITDSIKNFIQLRLCMNCGNNMLNKIKTEQQQKQTKGVWT